MQSSNNFTICVKKYIIYLYIIFSNSNKKEIANTPKLITKSVTAARVAYINKKRIPSALNAMKKQNETTTKNQFKINKFLPFPYGVGSG